MTADTLFSFANLMAMTGWILLTVAPRWKYTRVVLINGIIVLLAAAYLILCLLFFNNTDGGFGSLDGVSRLFSNKFVLLAGWIHYLAFDLFVGTWEVNDSRKHGISHFLIIPCLLLTFMLGPVGLLVYLFIRTIKTKRFTHNDFGDVVTG